MTKPDKKTR